MGWQPEYATVGELTAHTRISDTADDAQAAIAIATASRAIDNRCNRQFGKVPVAEARTYTPRWSRHRQGWRVPIDDLMTATGLLVAVDQDGSGAYATTIATYRLRPTNAVVAGQPWTELFIPSTAVITLGTVSLADSVQVTASWGWPGVPDAIRQACLLQASRLLSRRDSPYGIAGSPEVGSEMRLLARLDADVAVAVEPYRRRVWAA